MRQETSALRQEAAPAAQKAAALRQGIAPAGAETAALGRRTVVPGREAAETPKGFLEKLFGVSYDKEYQ